MKRLICTFLTCIFILAAGSAAFAGMDWEFSARHQALANTGNAIFNIKGLSPSLENIACLVGSPQYNILYEGSASSANMITNDDDFDYYNRSISGMTGLKTTYPTINRDDEDDFDERLSIAFIPGLMTTNFYGKRDFTGNSDHDDYEANDEETHSETYITLFQRIGLAYSPHEMVGIGIGFTLMPTTIIRVTNSGQIDGDDIQNDYTTYAPFMFSPELGILVRPVEFIQLGLSFEAGDLKSRRSDVTHTYPDLGSNPDPEDEDKPSGKVDETTDAIYARSPNLGFGFACMIPDMDYFMVGFDFDIDFRRGKATPYGHFADNQKAEWSVSLEKMFEMSSIKGGFGYADEVGTDRYHPYDRFFSTFGTDLYFDEHIMMGVAFKAELGYMASDPEGGLAFGGGFGWSFGGSF